MTTCVALDALLNLNFRLLIFIGEDNIKENS